MIDAGGVDESPIRIKRPRSWVEAIARANSPVTALPDQKFTNKLRAGSLYDLLVRLNKILNHSKW